MYCSGCTPLAGTYYKCLSIADSMKSSVWYDSEMLVPWKEAAGKYTYAYMLEIEGRF
jgi:hypothetical protein